MAFYFQNSRSVSARAVPPWWWEEVTSTPVVFSPDSSWLGADLAAEGAQAAPPVNGLTG